MSPFSSRRRGSLIAIAALVAVSALPAQVASATAFVTWTTPTDLTSSGYAGYPDFALSSDGTTAIAMWDVDSKIQVATASISGETATWSTPTSLESADVSSEFSVAISADGKHAIAAWGNYTSGDALKVAVATITNGVATWGSSTTLDATTAEVDVLMSADGSKATAVWIDADDELSTASATVSGTTATWGSVQDLTATGDVESVNLGLSSNGTRATVVWVYSGSGTNESVESRSATISGNTATWGTKSTPRSSPAYVGEASVALSTDGTKAAAIWKYKEPGTSTYGIQASVASVSGASATWSAVSSLTDPSDSRETDYPHIAISGNGSKVFPIWQREDAAGSSVYIIESKVGSVSGNTPTWGSTSSVSAAGGTAYGARINVTPDGTKAIAAWYRMSGVYFAQAAVATVSGTSATWATAVDLSAAGDYAFSPQVGISSDGAAATAVWQRAGLIQSASTGNAQKAAEAPDIDLKLNLNVGNNIKTDNLKVTTSGSGLKPNTPYTVVLRSTPVQIGSGTTDSSGSFTNTSPLPANTPAGSHSVTVNSKAPDGTNVSSVGYFSVGEDGVVTAISYKSRTPAPSNNLPSTGFANTLLIELAAAMIVAGAAISVARRRRTA